MTAGFVEGDAVTTVDGTSVTQLDARGVWILIANRPPGTTVKVTITRAGKPINGNLVLRAEP